MTAFGIKQCAICGVLFYAAASTNSSGFKHSANLLPHTTWPNSPSEPHRVTDLPFLSGHHGMSTKFRGQYGNEHMEGTTLHMLVSELGATEDIPLMCRLRRILFRDSQCGTFALTSLNAHDKQTLTKETFVHSSKCKSDTTKDCNATHNVENNAGTTATMSEHHLQGLSPTKPPPTKMGTLASHFVAQPSPSSKK